MQADTIEEQVSPKELIPLHTAAQRIGLTRRQAEGLISSAAVSTWRLGGRILLREADLRAAFHASRVVGATSN